MSNTPQDIEIEAKKRAVWLNRHGAPKGWCIVTVEEVDALKRELAEANADRLALREALQGCSKRLQVVLSEYTAQAPPESAKGAPSALENIRAVARALNSPPPPCVSMAEHQKVVDELNSRLRDINALHTELRRVIQERRYWLITPPLGEKQDPVEWIMQIYRQSQAVDVKEAHQ